VDVNVCLCSVDNTGMDSIDDDVGVLGLEVLVQPLGVQEVGQLAASVLRLRSVVLVQLGNGCKLGLAGGLGVQVGRNADDANFVALVGGLLNRGQQVAGQDNVTEVVDGQVKIDAVLVQLSGHDSTAGVVNEDVDSVGLRSDLCGDLAGLHPVGKITLLPDELLACLGSKLFLDCVQGFVGDLLSHGGDEKLGDVLREQGVSASETDTFAATSDNGDLLTPC